jgi:hypothetical protein
MTRFAAASALVAVLVSCVATSAGARSTAGAGVRVGPAMPPIAWGVSDDASKYAGDGGTWFYDELKGASLTQNRWTLTWDSTNPMAINELPFLERAAPKAQAAGVHILLSLYSTKASEHDPTAFCAWAAEVAQTVSVWGIHDYIVWNEPNTRLYWSPQRVGGTDVAAPAYETLLATCYDALHGADPAANVIGMGLSPRASTGDSNEPLVFLRDVGKAYMASGRTTPIMDQLSIHPYPNPSSPTDSPDVGYGSPDRFGVSNLDRVKQAVYDAFNGTGQPTTLGVGARRAAGIGNPLTFVIDEIGWQTDTSAYPQYANPENVKTVDEATQASYIKTMAEKYFACDPTVTSVQLFLLVDEKYRNGKDETGKTVGGGWQSGLLTAGGEGVSTPKLAYSQAAPDFAAGRSACTGAPISWSPATVVPLVKGAKSKGKSGNSKHGNKPAKKPAPKLKKQKKN